MVNAICDALVELGFEHIDMPAPHETRLASDPGCAAPALSGTA
jgi:hypothetical protein